MCVVKKVKDPPQKKNNNNNLSVVASVVRVCLLFVRRWLDVHRNPQFARASASVDVREIRARAEHFWVGDLTKQKGEEKEEKNSFRLARFELAKLSL